MTDNSVSHTKARHWGAAGMVMAALVVLATAEMGVAARHVASFEAINLETLGGNLSEASAVSDKGIVVGRSQDKDSIYHAVMWSQDARITDLGILVDDQLEPTAQSWATLITDKGDIAGFDTVPSKTPGVTNDFHAFVWTHANGFTVIPTLGGFTISPTAINSKGQVVGSSDPGDGTFHAFLWTQQDGITIDLGTLDPKSSTATSMANAISDNGIVVGQSTNEDKLPHAFMWTRHNGMVDLGTLGGLNSVAQGVNNDGVIVGTSDTTTNLQSHAFVWTKRTGMVDIGCDRLDPCDGLNSFGEEINGRFVIGQIFPTGGTKHGFAWTRKSGLVQIVPPDGGMSRAMAVNDSGVVVGNFVTGGAVRAFMWSASSGFVQLEQLESEKGTSQASAINGNFIVGSTCEDVLDVHCHATLWKPRAHSHKGRDSDRDDD